MSIRVFLLSRLSSRAKKILFSVLALGVMGVIVLLFLFWEISAPSGFPLNQVITIEGGRTLKEVAVNFEERNLIRSSFWFETIGWVLKTEKKIKAGEYFFEKKLSAISLMRTIAGSGYSKKFIKITIPEGFNLRDVGMLFENRGIWQAEEIWEVAGFPAIKNSMEGFLFPDTYFVPLNITPGLMVQIMRDNFENKITGEIKEKIKKSGYSLSETITIASLVEKEVADEKDRKLVAGILLKRLKSGMPLQIDAVFPYIIGKNSFQLTLEDLKTDSPYNTYLHAGLPVGPICNPGIESIEAVLNPTSSDYWYYLSDREGNTYYSVTYAEHLAKKEKYLK